jgi:copper chaperone CopZ
MSKSPAVNYEPQVIHRLPGRLRIHLPNWCGGNSDEVEARLRHVPGVRSVEASSLTGNVLIIYDPRAAVEQELLTSAGEFQVPPRAEPKKNTSPLVKVGLRGLLGHAAVDALFFTVAFVEPFGLPLAGLGALHLGFDAIAWGVALRPLLAEAR